MSYYGQGDYYQGDYYRGDPGLFDFLGKVAKGAFNFLAPSPIKAAVHAGSSMVLYQKHAAEAKRARVAAGYTGHAARTPPAFPGTGMAPSYQLPRLPAPRYPRGRGGAVVTDEAGYPIRGFGRKRRRMNPLNIKALRRADRRARSFLKISARLVKHFVGKKKRGKAYIKTSRARK
jgi:hypothetical protein